MYDTNLILDDRSRRSYYEMHRTLSTRYRDEPRLLWRPSEYGATVRTTEPIDESSRAVDPAALTGAREFQLWANPVVCRSGRRRGLRGTQSLLKWLHRKMADAGCTVLDARVHKVATVWAKNDARGASFTGVEFRGLLRIDDRELLTEALASGIGPGKAFGFGMLAID